MLGRLGGRTILLCCAVACDGTGDVEVVRGTPEEVDAAEPVHPDAGSDGSSAGAGAVDAGEEPSSDAAVSPVRLGVVPLPWVGGDAPVGAGEQAMAHLEVLAAGSRAVSLVRRWDELYAAPFVARDEAWAELESAAALYADARRTVLLCLSIVDGRVDARPDGASPGWYDIASRRAAEALVDRVWLTFGRELGYLVIGREVDRWLARSDPSSRSAFVELVRHVLSYAQDHPARPESVRIGVTASRQGWVSGLPELDILRVESDVVAATYFPLDADLRVPPPASAAADLDELVGVLGTADEPPSVILQEVGYPSSAEVGSSEPTQQLFFESLLQALGSRRSRIPFVGVYALHEPEPEQCEAQARAMGLGGQAQAIAARCSLGLHDRVGAPKPSWLTVSAGLAAFAVP